MTRPLTPPAPGRLHPLRRAEASSGFDHRLISPMMLGAILNPINSSIVAVALVPIGMALGAPASETAWLVSGLYLATSIGQPVVGRLVDLYGSRRLFLTGAILVGLGGLLGAVAPSIWVLVLSRVILGFGTCAGYPSAMSLIRSEADRTGRDSPASVLTVLAVSTQTVAVIGPTLGGLLIGLGGWRATFAVNLPLALACLVLGARRLPKAPPVDRRERAGLARRIDLVGILLFSGTLVALLLFLTHLRPDLWYLLAIAVVVAAGFVAWELRAASPFLDLRVLGGNRALLATYARALLAAVTSYALLYGYTQWLEQGRGLSASVAGLVLLPIFATGIAVSVISGRRPGDPRQARRRSRRPGPRRGAAAPARTGQPDLADRRRRPDRRCSAGPQQPGQPERRVPPGRPRADGLLGGADAHLLLPRRDHRLDGQRDRPDPGGRHGGPAPAGARRARRVRTVPRAHPRRPLPGPRRAHPRAGGPVMRSLPLDGVLVVSCEQAVAAPLATRHLADLGARVIKVERPGRGDFARDYDTTVAGLSSHFVWLNRSKESVALDLKDPEAIAALRRILARADVFVQNFAPGAAERLGLGASELRAAHPRLITCSVSGYGSSGPYRDAKAYDLLIQSEAGLVSVTGTEEHPAKAGIPAADIGAGMYAFSGILAALYERERTGEGTAVEVSLFDALTEWMGFPLNYAMGSGHAPRRTGTSHAAIAPYGCLRGGRRHRGRARDPERPGVAALLRRCPG